MAGSDYGAYLMPCDFRWGKFARSDLRGSCTKTARLTNQRPVGSCRARTDDIATLIIAPMLPMATYGGLYNAAHLFVINTELLTKPSATALLQKKKIALRD